MGRYFFILKKIPNILIPKLPVFALSSNKSESLISGIDKSAKICCWPIFRHNFDQVLRKVGISYKNIAKAKNEIYMWFLFHARKI